MSAAAGRLTVVHVLPSMAVDTGGPPVGCAGLTAALGGRGHRVTLAALETPGRATVPVAQMPPNSAEPILAIPCGTSSMLEGWRRPVMPSATIAESSDSMAPSSAKDSASGSTSPILAMEMGGRDGAGNEFGMPPKRVPMVSTGSFSR